MRTNCDVNHWALLCFDHLLITLRATGSTIVLWQYDMAILII